MLIHLEKLEENVVSLILNCIVHRKCFVLDAAVELCQLLRKNRNSFQKKNNKKNKEKNKKEKKKDKEEKSEIQIVSQVLGKMIKQRLGTSLMVCQAVSSCCLLSVHLNLEMGKELEYKEEEIRRLKKKKEDTIALKESKDQMRAGREIRDNSNELISSSFDRLALTALSPYLSYEDVHWLTLSSNLKGNFDISDSKKCETVVEVFINESSLLGNDSKLLSPQTRRRRSNCLDESSFGSGRELKKKKSFNDEVVPVLIEPPKSKRECLCEIIRNLQARYIDVKSLNPALKRLARSYRPSTGNISGGTPESEYSPIVKNSKGVDSPDYNLSKLLSSKDDGVTAGSVGNIIGRSLLRAGDLLVPIRSRVKILAGERTKPMIPLSVAGTALLLSRADIPDAIPLLESADLVSVKAAASIPMGKGDHTLKRTNSIVNVHKPIVGQRTGRGKGKNVRTSLKPDPNINSILSFTVLQKRSPTKGGRTLKKTSNSEKDTDTSNLSAPLSDARNRHQSNVENLETISTVRRSARKRDREESDGWQSQHTQSTVGCDVSEVEDTPFEKIRARKSRGYGSALRVLRGESPGPRDIGGRPPNANDIAPGISTRRRSGSKSTQDETTSKGIAILSVNTSFSSGGSGKRKSSRSLISSPFFLPPVELRFGYSLSQDDDKEDFDGNKNYSAAAALGMEELSQKKKKMPRMIRLPPQSQNPYTSISHGSITIPDAIINSTVPLDTGSFTRIALEQPSRCNLVEVEDEFEGTNYSLVQMQGTPLAIPRYKRGRGYSELSSPIEQQNLTRTFSKSPKGLPRDDISRRGSKRSPVTASRYSPRTRRSPM